MGRNNNYLNMNSMENLWEKIKAWFLNKPWIWIKKHWFMIVNYVVIVLSYNNVYGKEGAGFAEVLLGLWIFASIAYVAWKWFNKKQVQPIVSQPEPIIESKPKTVKQPKKKNK